MGVFRHLDGKVGIYTGADDAPFNDPLGNLSRVLFHSDLNYPAIVREVSGTLTLPARGANSGGWTAHNLFPHGRSGTPLVLGYIVMGSLRQRIAGSVPVQGNAYGWARWLSIGADTTNVKMAESWFNGGPGGGSPYGAISVAWRVFVLETTFESNPALTDEALYISPTDFRAGRGKFNARNRYLRNGNTLQNFPVVIGGHTLVFSVGGTNVALTFSLAGQVFRTNYTYSPAPDVTLAVVGPAFNAAYTLVTT